ncbi:type II secretion system F family protein [Desulfitobacterium sp. AusDCA]|uniref:type II secretion system F family protein n=1 Tax=Desulfitobacterium sp. AusDCA TaxID=3240383 RepID=UPI003DA74FE0
MYMLVIVSGIFGFVVFVILAIFSGNNAQKPHERIQLALGRNEVELNEELPPLRERFLIPVLRKLTSVFSFFSSSRRNKANSKEVNQNEEVGELKSLQLFLGLLIGLLLLALYSLLHVSFLAKIVISILGFLMGYMLPGSWQKAQIKKKQAEIEKSLPDILDLLTVSVEAGLGFDSALLKVVEKQKGALAEEFLKVLQEIKMGRPRREALRDLSKRNPLEDLSNVIAALVQADQLGIPIAGVLRNQSKQIREKHRQRAEEKAQKAPVKMMIPLVFFIFPSIFIIILGPAVIKIIDMFAKK